MELRGRGGHDGRDWQTRLDGPWYAAHGSVPRQSLVCGRRYSISGEVTAHSCARVSCYLLTLELDKAEHC